MDELTLKKTILKGEQAQKVIDSHKETWDDIESDIWDMWKKSKSNEKDAREDLYREQHAIKAIQARLERLVNKGKQAEEELKQQKVRNV